ncbi:MAG: hypothetical protein QOE38_1177, partial [Thermoleophilaceae bacterium]|nr:hypothetical protein [Thermoleophilaceae bacterium]
MRRRTCLAEARLAGARGANLRLPVARWRR